MGVNSRYFWCAGIICKKIQTIIKTYRSQSIEQWKLGKIKIPINGKEMNPNNVIDVKTIENNFMPWAKDPNKSKNFFLFLKK